MHLGSRMFYIPEQELIWIGTDDRCLSPRAIDEDLIILQTNTRGINKSIGGSIIQYLLRKSDRIEKLEIHIRRNNSRDISLNKPIYLDRELRYRRALGSRDTRQEVRRITPRGNSPHKDMFRPSLDKFADIVRRQSGKRDGQLRQCTGRITAGQGSEDVVCSAFMDILSLIGDFLDVEVLRNEIVIDLRHETWRTVVAGGIVDDGSAIGIVVEILDRDMFDPDGTIGKAELVVRREGKAAIEELAVAVAIIGKRVSKEDNLASIRWHERYTLCKHFPETSVRAQKLKSSKVSILEMRAAKRVCFRHGVGYLYLYPSGYGIIPSE